MLRLIRSQPYFFLPYALLLAAVGAALLAHPRTDLMLQVNDFHTPQADAFFRYFTHLGDGLMATAVALGLLLFSYRAGLTAGLCFLLSGQLTQLLKRTAFAHELRPLEIFRQQHLAFHAVPGLELHSLNSFPSGHATTAFALGCFLSLMARPRSWGLFFFALAVWAAFSRVYLFQHFVADVYAGSLVGTITTLLVCYGLDRYWAAHPTALRGGLLRKAG